MTSCSGRQGVPATDRDRAPEPARRRGHRHPSRAPVAGGTPGELHGRRARGPGTPDGPPGLPLVLPRRRAFGRELRGRGPASSRPDQGSRRPVRAGCSCRSTSRGARPPASYLNHLLPLPYTEESLAAVCRNVDEVQTALGRRVLVENPSAYLRFATSTIPEAQFLAELVRRTGCGLLCDVNNVYVTARNLGLDPVAYLDALPADAVGEIHLAGHSANDADGRTLLIDDHGSPVAAAVWALYDHAIRRFGAVPTLVEWDTEIPALEVLAGGGPTSRHPASEVPSMMQTLPELQAALRRGAPAEGRPGGRGRDRRGRRHARCASPGLLEPRLHEPDRAPSRRPFPSCAGWWTDGSSASRRIATSGRHPPTGPCLFEYGATFPAFLEAFPPCAGHPYLADVARLEWAMNVASHADDAAPIAPAALESVRPEDVGRLVLRLDPSASWLRSPWPIDRIWRANQPDADPAGTVDLAAGGVTLEVRRRDDVRHDETARGRGVRRSEPALGAGATLEMAAARHDHGRGSGVRSHGAHCVRCSTRRSSPGFAVIPETPQVAPATPTPRRPRRARRKDARHDDDRRVRGDRRPDPSRSAVAGSTDWRRCRSRSTSCSFAWASPACSSRRA